MRGQAGARVPLENLEACGRRAGKPVRQRDDERGDRCAEQLDQVSCVGAIFVRSHGMELSWRLAQPTPSQLVQKSDRPENRLTDSGA